MWPHRCQGVNKLVSEVTWGREKTELFQGWWQKLNQTGIVHAGLAYHRLLAPDFSEEISLLEMLKGITMYHPKNMPLWQKDDFELQAINKQEERLASPFLCKSRACISLCKCVPHLLPSQEQENLHYHQREGRSTFCTNKPY